MRRSACLWILVIVVLCSGCDSERADSISPCGAPPELAYSEDMARNLDSRLLPYLQGKTGSLDLDTTSQEFTSWIEYSTVRWSGLPLKDAVVWFSPEHIHFSGLVTRILPFSASVQLHARVWLDAQTPQLALEDACIGTFALPAWLEQLAERIANETIRDYGPYLRLDELHVGNGTLSVRGQVGY